MIEITFDKKTDEIVGFHIKGHAYFARRGKDIVCSAVSSLALNTVNSVKELTDADFSGQVKEDGGMIDFTLNSHGQDATLLINSFELGVKGIMESYPKNVRITYREV